MLSRRFLSCLVGLVVVGAMQGCIEDEQDVLGETEQAAHVAPSNVAVTQTTASRAQVSWTGSVGATKYYVYQSIAGGAFNFRGTSTSLAYVVGGLLNGVEYCYQVAADGPQGISPASAPPACITLGLPGAPMNVSAIPTAYDRATVTWTGVSGATKYYVYQATDAAGPYSYIQTAVSPSTQITAGNLASGTNYCFKVAAETSTGVSAQSVEGCTSTFAAGVEGFWKFNETSGTTVTDSSTWLRIGTRQGAVSISASQPPLDNNPRSLQFAGGTADAVSIPSNTVFGFTGAFTIALWAKVDVSPAGTLRLIGKREAACGTVNWELAQDATNQLHLVGAGGAIRSFGQSLPLGEWTHVAVTRTSSGLARMYLNGVQVASGAYTVGPTNTAPLQIGNSGGCGSAASFIDFVAVQSRDLTPAEVATLGKRPPAPTNFLATVASSKRVNLSWDALTPSATKYFIYKGTASGNQTFYNSVLAPALTFSDNINQPATQVSYYIQAIRDGLVSLPSPEQIVTTNPAPLAPATVTATVASTNRIRVDWTASTNATKYYIYESANGGVATYRGTAIAPAVTFTVGSLTVGSTYTYYVIAEDAAGVRSAPSATTTPITL